MAKRGTRLDTDRPLSSDPTGLGGMSSKRITINKILSNESLVQENQYFQVSRARACGRERL